MSNRNPLPIPAEMSRATQFKPGNKFGAGGSLKRATIILRRTRYENFIGLLENITAMPKQLIEAWQKEEGRGALEEACAKVAIEAANGHMPSLALILERMFGRPRDINMTLNEFTAEELAEELKRRIAAERPDEIITVAEE